MPTRPKTPDAKAENRLSAQLMFRSVRNTKLFGPPQGVNTMLVAENGDNCAIHIRISTFEETSGRGSTAFSIVEVALQQRPPQPYRSGDRFQPAAHNDRRFLSRNVTSLFTHDNLYNAESCGTQQRSRPQKPKHGADVHLDASGHDGAGSS